MEVPECEMPGIPIESSNLEILETPTQFYEKLLELTARSERRIALSSLYLGEGLLEKQLVSTIRERIDQVKDIDVTILLDLLRGTRRSSDGESSVTVMKPISDRAKIFLYHTPELNGLVKRVLPQRADEIIGLQHMKLYIFDDNVLISGANLSDSYFTDRTDRWFLFKNCKTLADFFHEIITTVGESSFIVQNDEVVPSSKCDVHPYLGGSQSYRDLLKLRVESVIEKYREARKNDKTVSETWIYPILQMGLLGIHQEYNLLNKVFAMKDAQMKMTMASGYFNFIRDYEDLILNEGTYQLDILTASPFANGFFGSKGFSKYIPPLYSNISEQFLLKMQRSNRLNVQMHQYFKEGWTFHAKGLWTEHDNKIMTLVGSSNYGYRSVHRDLEAQVMVVTTDPNLMGRLREEKDRLFKCSTHLDMVALQQPEHHIPPIIRVISRLVRSFL
ncbi:unnamed protein product [Caenorhabditis nigoni]